MSQVTKEYVQALLLREDTVGMHAVGRALGVLLANQTADEVWSESTKYLNARGFTPSDARIGTSMAGYYKRNGYLTPRQMAYWQRPARTEAGRIRILKYWRQLIDAAQQRAMQKHEKLAA